MKKKVTHPNFYLGLISFILLILGVSLRANSFVYGDYVIFSAIALGAIHWIWSIIDVFKDYRMSGAENRRIIWVIIVILVPPIGGMCYYLLGRGVKM